MGKEAFFSISYGVYIVSSVLHEGDKDKLNGQIANSLFQVTSEPATIAVSINKQNLTHECIKSSKVLSISVLAESAPMSLIGLFGFKCGRDLNKFEAIHYKVGQTGSPVVLESAVAYFEMKITQEIDCGTHTIFIGDVITHEKLSDTPPMTYAYYQTIKRGKAPATAPTYIKEEKSAAEISVKYRCAICGYIYDPKLGDLENGIKPGTPFEEIPGDWVCPICGADKSQFEKET